MKIISVDNFAREDVADNLIAENIKYEAVGNVMVAALNAKYSGTYSPVYYRLVPDDYVLSRGIEDLI